MAFKSWPKVVPTLRVKDRVKRWVHEGSVRGRTVMSRLPRTGAPSEGCSMTTPSEDLMVGGLEVAGASAAPWPSLLGRAGGLLTLPTSLKVASSLLPRFWL